MFHSICFVLVVLFGGGIFKCKSRIDSSVHRHQAPPRREGTQEGLLPSYVLAHFLSACPINYQRRNAGISTWKSGFDCSFFPLNPVFSHVFWSPVIRHMSVENCYIFSMALPPHHYETSRSSMIGFCLTFT